MNCFAYLLAGSQRKHARYQCKHLKYIADSSEPRISLVFHRIQEKLWILNRFFFG